MTRRIERHKTAIGRSELSRPVRAALDAGFISTERSFFDYGCGRGDDLRRLESLGIAATGWDPVHRSEATKQSADVVNLGYVVNVIEDAAERADVVTSAWRLAQSLLVVSARLSVDVDGKGGESFQDGIVTRLNTFQKFYTQGELRAWLDEVLEVPSVAAAPGIFYVFRDVALREAYLATRYTRTRKAPTPRKSDVLFEEHLKLLEPLIEFVATRARLPARWELDSSDQIEATLGSIRKAFAIVRRVTGSDQWDEGRVAMYQDLLVHLALSRFGKRPRFSELPEDLQLDIREFFSSYRNACESADRMLFSAGDMQIVEGAMKVAPVGKRTGNALYVHRDATSELPPILRVYEGCARLYIGDVEGANLIKLHRGQPRVSYLSYPGFDRDPHPALARALVIPLQSLEMDLRDYTRSVNPPVLHRKESFLSPVDPRRPKFERLTKQEERWGLFDNPELIGTMNGWTAALQEKGCCLRGHRLVRTTSKEKQE